MLLFWSFTFLRIYWGRVLSVFFAVLVVLAHPAAVATVAANGHGEFTIDIRHENGGQVNEVNALIIYQDSWSNIYQKVENYPSVDLKHVFSNLPTGHEYRVSAYIQDQSAGTTGWVTISNDKWSTPGDESSVSKTITAKDPARVKVQAFHDDGSTPLEGATMQIESHEGIVWRSGTMGENGYALTPSGSAKFWLYPTNSGYYTIEIHHDRTRVQGPEQASVFA